MSMISVCLPSDALLQHLPSYLGFSYLGHGISLHDCSSKVQLLLLTLEEGYLLTPTLPELQCGIVPLGPPVPVQPPLLGHGLIFLATIPDLGRVCLCSPLPAPSQTGTLGHCPSPQTWGSSSRPHCQLSQLLALSVLVIALSVSGRS